MCEQKVGVVSNEDNKFPFFFFLVFEMNMSN